MNRLLVVLFLLLQALSFKGYSQKNATFSLLVISSDGTAQMNSEKAESYAKDIKSAISTAFKVNHRTSELIQCNGSTAMNLNQVFYRNLINQMPDDFLFIVMAGGWDVKWNETTKDRSFSNFIVRGEDEITPDYLVNFLKLSPAKNIVVFMLSSSSYPFPPLEEIEKLPSLSVPGGRFIIKVEAAGEKFTKLLSLFSDAIEETDFLYSDKNINKIKTGDWFSAYEKTSKENNLTNTIYKISGDDGLVIKVKENN